MSDLCGGLMILALVVGAVAVVGHLLWLLLAAILKALSGEGTDRRTLRCPGCQQELQLQRGKCIACGLPIKIPPSFPRPDPVAEFESQLSRLLQRGTIDTEQHQTLTQALRKELESPWILGEGPEGAPAAEKRVLHREAAPAPTPAPRPLEAPGEERVAAGAPALPRESAVPRERVGGSAPAGIDAGGRPAPPVPVPAAAPALSDLFRAFMDENNIRWGELISGIGLVISLWETLKDTIPYFPALLFMLVTAAIHGAGMYTLHRWNLKSTSRGLLIISVLLIPLNYLAAVALSYKRPADNWLFWMALGTGLAVFGVMTWTAGRKLLLRGEGLLPIGVVGASAGQVLISRVAGPGQAATIVNLLFAIPLVSFLAGAVGQLAMAGTWPRLTVRRVTQIFLVVAVSLFALLVAVGILVWKCESLRLTLAHLSPSLSLAAAVILATGGLVHRRAVQPGLATWRTAGTAIALAGGAGMLGCVILAWPRPELLVGVGIINFLALTALALVLTLAPLHVPGILSLALAGLIGFHLSRGHLHVGGAGPQEDLLSVLLYGESGIVLLVFSALSAAAAYAWRRAARLADTAAALWGTLGLGILSTLVAVYSGFLSGVDRDLATLVFAVYAVALLGSDQRLRHWGLGTAGSGLMFAAFAHGLAWNTHVRELLEKLGCQPERPLIVALLLHGTIFAVLGFVIPRVLREPGAEPGIKSGLREFLAVRSYSAMISSVLAMPVVLFGLHDSTLTRSGYGFWGAGIWMAVAVGQASAELFTAAQGLATVAVVLAVTGVCQRRPWWDGALWGAPHLHAQMGTLAAWSAAWAGIRRLLRLVPRAAFLREASWPAVDRVVLAAVVAGVPLLAALACGPGVAAELQVLAGGSSMHVAPLVMALVLIALAVGICVSFGAEPGMWRDRSGLVIALFSVTFFLALPFWRDLADGYWRGTKSAPDEAFSAGAWIVLAIVAAAVVVSLVERISAPALYGLVWLSVAIPLLAAGPFGAANATASALRWTIAVYGVAMGLALGSRTWLEGVARRVGLTPAEGDSLPIVGRLRDVALTLTIAPLLALTLDAALPAAVETMLRGPSLGSFFHRLGAEWSLAGPLLVLGATLGGYSLRERLPRLALAGSFVVQLAVAAYLVANRASRGVTIDGPTVVEFIHWNGLALAAYSLGWLALEQRIEPEAAEPRPVLYEPWSPLNVQALLTAAMALVLPVWSTVVVVISPRSLPPVTAALGSPLGYAVLGLAVVVVGQRLKALAVPYGMATITMAGLATVGLGAASAAVGNTADNWVSYHILMAGWTAVALLTTTACLAPGEFRRLFAALARSPIGPAVDEAEREHGAVEVQELSDLAAWCTTVVGGLVLLLAVRGLATDPARPYWGVASTALLAGLSAILALRRRSQIFAYTSARLAALAATYAWTTPWLGLGLVPTPQAWVNVAEATAVTATLAGAFWLAIELWYERHWGTPFDPTFAYPPVHRGTSRLALIVACGLAAAALGARWIVFDTEHPVPFAVSNSGGWLLVASLGGVHLGSLWDRRAVRAVPSLYALGLTAAGLVIDWQAPLGPDVPWFMALGLSAHVAVTAVIWGLRERLAEIAAQRGIPEPAALLARAARWLPHAALVLASLTAAVEFQVVLTLPELVKRLAGGAAVAVVAASLPAFAQEERRVRFRELGLLFLAIAAVDFGWGVMPVEAETTYWLQRGVRLLVVLAATTIAYGVIWVRVLSAGSEWFTAVRTAATMVGGGSLASLGAVLVLEGYWFDPVTGAPLSGVQIAVVAAVLVGLTAALISLAVLPGRDPLDLSESGRMYYVYTAEIVLALLFLHVYLTMPELFHGYLLPYWPLIVMGIAYFGVGVGELFRRSNLRVLSEPLHRTGAFLPLLPALGFWIQSSRTSYSTLLFVVGLMYVVLSLWRGAFLYSLAAALAGNAGLWALWHEHGVRLVDHPQLWLIPPAVSVLVAAQLNRRKLTEEQVTGIRYLCTTVIYVSSTGDMFITGIGENLALPMILAGLSVVGVLAGIALRVRAFLYLGSSFLLLSIVSMVWHAARHINHVWPWWAFGIGLGLAILTLLGVFENKRKEVQAVLDNVRRWEP